MKILILLSLVAVASSISHYEVVREEWEAWKAHHGKNYNSVMEDTLRMKIFMENKAR